MSSTPLDLPPVTVRPAREHRRPARDLLVLLRPHQWVKNLLVVPLPLVHPSAWNLPSLARLAGAVLIFILASSVVYVGNDIADRDRDRRHPVKRHRPIAAGHVSVALAAGAGCALAALLVVLLAVVSPGLAWPVAGYLALNVLYSVWLKHVPVVDLFVVVLGFEARIVAGYQAVGSAPSVWLLLCVFFLCLTLILGKRRREIDDAGSAHRPALAGYSAALVDQMLTLSAGLTAVAFLLFLGGDASSAASDNLATLVLVPLSLFGLFRYLRILTLQGVDGDPVRALLRDRVIVSTALLSAGLLAVLLGVDGLGRLS
ncbi:UbiA prenyltransferase family protein [Sphaerisporangium viridialbum]|uniref:UbiA prenyltransferase family protein n=1 Tax=Sphaerisporangium viridialbum TaxID=46189 RepID=UPI003C768F66